MSLSEKSCVPCRTGGKPLAGDEIERLGRELNHWTVSASHHLEKEFVFRNFTAALAFVNKVGAIAEEQDHHPDIYLAYGKVGLKFWTHTVDGLTENDFILAAKVDALGG